MIFATLTTIFIAFLLLKKKKVKEFFLFLVILLIISFPSLETFIETNIHLPIKNFFNTNNEVTKTFTNSLPSLIKLFYLLSSITIAYCIFQYSLKLVLNYHNTQSIVTISQKHYSFYKLSKNLFTFKKPNGLILA